MLSAVSAPAATLPEQGSCWVTNDAQTADAVEALIEAAHRFFTGDAATRNAAAAGTTMTGWRKAGIEYSQSPDRPDLNETFCYRRHDDNGSLFEHPLLERAREAQVRLDLIAADALEALATRIGVRDRPAVRTMNESWLQLNFSRPATAAREFIQDAHEDGHLLTFLVADARGLEVKDPKKGWVAVLPSPERMICFAGECGSLLTGDLVSPTQHRVRAHTNVPVRLSVAYFVNPDLDQELPPWVPMMRSEGVDLLRWGQQNPARFGLPTL